MLWMVDTVRSWTENLSTNRTVAGKHCTPKNNRGRVYPLTCKGWQPQQYPICKPPISQFQRPVFLGCRYAAEHFIIVSPICLMAALVSRWSLRRFNLTPGCDMMAEAFISHAPKYIQSQKYDSSSVHFRSQTRIWIYEPANSCDDIMLSFSLFQLGMSKAWLGCKANGDGRIHRCHGCWRWFGTARRGLAMGSMGSMGSVRGAGGSLVTPKSPGEDVWWCEDVWSRLDGTAI